MTTPKFLVLTLACLILGSAAASAQDDRLLPDDREPIRITDLAVKGKIEGENITFSLDFTVETRKKNLEVPLIAGEVVLEEVQSPKEGYKLRYAAPQAAQVVDAKSAKPPVTQPATRPAEPEGPSVPTYYLSFPEPGVRHVAVTFAARPVSVERGAWREAQFLIPAARVRQLEVTCDRTDLEVLFPGAMRLERELKQGALVLTAVFGSDRPFAVRWKPQLPELDAKLVVSSTANAVVTAGVGALRVDTLFQFDIAQGKLSELTFAVPRNLSVTQVRGEFIRDWKVEPPKAGAPASTPGTLRVTLTRPQTQSYPLQVLGEAAIAAFPTEVELPVVAPEGGIRAGGQLAVGTDSAIQLQVKQTAGLAQVDNAAFPRVILAAQFPRALPRAKMFSFTHATSPYQMKLALDDIVPTYDATQWVKAEVREDDLTLTAELELDVRDAPIRAVVLEAPARFTVAGVGGPQVAEYNVRKAAAGAALQEIEVQFRQPVIGRTLLGVRLELGAGPLGRPQTLTGLRVRGAKTQRGYLAVAAESGVQLDVAGKVAEPLREVNPAALPMKAPDAQLAYRFREANWALELAARKKPAGIRAEAFHLVSLGEGVAYGSVAVSYFITGSPIDELAFTVPAELQNVEFVGKDVRRWTQDPQNPTHWTVKLQRKVIGDYNLAVSYTQRYPDGGTILLGGVDCRDVATQTGYVAVASHQHLDLGLFGKTAAEGAAAAPPAGSGGLLEIEAEELPANYRLLVSAPLLKTYKYIRSPHDASLRVAAYARGDLLPVVVELMDLKTTVDARDEGNTETVTTVRYLVKNASSQFLSFHVPPGATLWSTSFVQRDAPTGAEQRVRVTAAHDKEKHVLLVPLERKGNPNEPTAIEVVYAEKHPPLGWSGRIELSAPTSGLHSTFDNWTVQVPETWAIHPGAGSTMIPGPRALARTDSAR